MIRQVAQRARLQGKDVGQEQDTVTINGTKYDLDSIHQIADTRQERVNQTQAGNRLPKGARERLQQEDKSQDDHLKYAENLCTLDTPYGMAFFTIRSRLSNFYPCSIMVNGRRYKSVEHGYQAEKAIFANDLVRLKQIMDAKEPSDAKRIGAEVAVSVKWLHMKRDVMRKLLYAKFSQHPELGEYLCSTKGKTLIEGSLDDYWGAGVPLHSKDMMQGNWVGRNELRGLQQSVRDKLLQEQEATLLLKHKPLGQDVNLINLDEDTNKNKETRMDIDTTQYPLVVQVATKQNTVPTDTDKITAPNAPVREGDREGERITKPASTDPVLPIPDYYHPSVSSDCWGGGAVRWVKLC